MNTAPDSLLFRNPALPLETRVQDLLGRLNLAEKIGQLHQESSGSNPSPDDIAAGRIGSIIVADSAWTGSERSQRTRTSRFEVWQKTAVEQSRHGIPLIFGRDVIHGYRTVFPLPVGQACSWDPALIEAAAAVAAREARPDGIHWTFTPMLDIAFDPRWGRIAEGFGEDPYLASVSASAAVRGYQGDLGRSNMAACAKHFVGYGAAEAGRDYDSAEISSNTMRNVYLRPFLAAVKAGCATVMSGFHDVGGIPASADHALLRGVLKDEWQWDGCVVSDWGSVIDLVNHGVAEGPADCARLSLRAGVDIEMCSGTFQKHLEAELAAGRVSLAEIDDACARVLRLKFRLGLFEYPWADPQEAATMALCAEHRALARQFAAKSVVMLKNDHSLLPLKDDTRFILTGVAPLFEQGEPILGTWPPDGDPTEAITLQQGMARFTNMKIENMVDVAITKSSQYETIVCVVGESSFRSGEAAGISNLELPAGQIEIVEALARTGKPLIVIVLAGRPLAMERLARSADAILWCYHPGTEGGNAIADVLSGAQEPVGRLCTSLPYVAGQIPVHYNHKNSGRPPGYNPIYYTKHIDCPREALYPFGFGLGYTTWSYDEVSVTPGEIPLGSTVRVRARVKNTGPKASETIVQCYLRDPFASRTRPVRELVAFCRVRLESGASTEVEFTLGEEALGFWGDGETFRVEPGEFRVWVGGDCRAEAETTFRVR